MTNVGPGHERYYLDQVALGTERPGWWLGGLSAELGLSGEVREETFRRVLEGQHPESALSLRSHPTAIRGRDLTFSQPKSLSVFWALSPTPVAEVLEKANTVALTAACGYIERQGVWLNDGSRGPGMAAAAFPHRTSRAGDPHLHTHVVVANLVRSRTGHRAVSTLPLAAVLRTAGYLYQAELRYEVSFRLGLEWGEVNHGVAQLQAVPEPLRRAFSRRRQQVERTMAEHHGRSPRSARLAALVDRPERDTDLDQMELRNQWQEQARRVGFDPEHLTDSISTTSPPGPADRDRRAQGFEAPGPGAQLGELGLDGLSSFSRTEVLEALSRIARQGGTIADIEQEAERLLASGEVRRFQGPVPLRRRDVARTPSGSVVVTREPRWRSGAVAEAEARLARSARGGMTTGLARTAVPSERVADGEVDRALCSLLESGHGIELVECGSGWRRDAVLAGASRAWADAGMRVMLAGTGATAAELGDVTGLTVHSLGSVTEGLTQLRSGGPAVVVVAGAESLPSGELADLAEATARMGSKLVLVGDPGLLPDLDQAGGWRAARAAVGSLHLGREAPGIGPTLPAEPGLQAAPWLVLSPGPVAVRQRLVADWLSAPAGAAMVASRRSDIDELNRRARTGLIEQTRLGQPIGLPGLADARQGEAVVVGRAASPARRLGLKPGTTLHLDGTHLVSDSGDRWSVGRVPIEADLRYAYARTPYQAWRANSSPLLVLGPPPPGPRPAGSVYYTVGPSRTRPAEMTLAQRAWIAGGYDRPLSRERTRERSLGRG